MESVLQRVKHWHGISVPVLVSLLTAYPVGLGIAYPVILGALVFEKNGYSATLNGISIASSLFGVLVGLPLALRLTRRRFYSAQIVLISYFVEAVLICIMALWFNPWLWIVLRFFVGIFGASQWLFSESWLIAYAPDHRRAFLLGVYGAIIALGYLTAPVLIALFGSEPELIAIAAGLFLLCFVLIYMTRERLPRMPLATGGIISWQLCRAMPLAVVAALISGFVEEAVQGFTPVWSLRNGWGEVGAARALIAFGIGSVLWQFPIGWLADRLGPRVVLAATCIISLVVPFLLILATDPKGLFYLTLFFLWGGAIFSVYSVALAAMGKDLKLEEIVRANGLYIVCFCIGVIIGTPVIGYLMEQFGADAYLVTVALAPILILLSFRLRRRKL